MEKGQGHITGNDRKCDGSNRNEVVKENQGEENREKNAESLWLAVVMPMRSISRSL